MPIFSISLTDRIILSYLPNIENGIVIVRQLGLDAQVLSWNPEKLRKNVGWQLFLQYALSLYTYKGRRKVDYYHYETVQIYSYNPLNSVFVLNMFLYIPPVFKIWIEGLLAGRMSTLVRYLECRPWLVNPHLLLLMGDGRLGHFLLGTDREIPYRNMILYRFIFELNMIL